MRRRRMLAEINVVPYIDVMLVLLVIFMVTAPMLMQGVEVDLPDADAAPVKEQDADRTLQHEKALKATAGLLTAMAMAN